MSSSEHLAVTGTWPACGHEGPADTRTGPGLGHCLRPPRHRERADGTGPVLHRDRLHEWEEQPEQPWWTALALDSDADPLT